ncbi:HTH domain-containing protein [Natrinema gelatinilyticum]|uniref:HTH domain-containing protein n=1 Tax=Natrinema gelatinilyticum TaxID=2961571 RepID=UPI0020C4C591|nr:HTH domain-containing protein [Natrinema gelatinilyticum]
MSARKPAVHPVVDPAQQGSIRVDCYVRSNVPPSVSEQIRALVDRVRSLREHGFVDEVRVTRWPPQQSMTEETGSTCNDLVAEFEQWAERNGYSLEPGFRRREIPPSPLGLASDSRERVRVPIVALALYEDDAETEVLRGVVPCTDRSVSDDDRTYTVDGWLTTVETRVLDDSASASQIDQLPLVDRQ